MFKQKDLFLAIIIWLFLGGLGLHRVYAKDKIHYLFWYWIVTICTLGIILWVDVFFLKKWVKEFNDEQMTLYKQSI